MRDVERQLVSGALSGLAATLCLQPFDLLKTRIQQVDGIVIQSNASIIARTARSIVASNGVHGLWRGTSATLLRNIPGVALYMTSVTQLRSAMASMPQFKAPDSNKQSVLPTLSSQGNLVAGATARIVVGFFLNPFSVLKARFESNIYQYNSLTYALSSMARLGPSELLRGFVASSLRDAPYAGIFVVFYEGLKREAGHIPGLNNYTTIVNGFSAASAGALATVATHPFDVIKTKIQVRPEKRYQGLTNTIHTIWMQRGPFGFFDGVSLRMVGKILRSGIGWAVFESTLAFLAHTPIQPS